MPVEIRSRGRVLVADELDVPEQLVLTIPSSAPEPKLLVGGVEWASSPGGGGWGISSGEGCPDGLSALRERPDDGAEER